MKQMKLHPIFFMIIAVSLGMVACKDDLNPDPKSKEIHVNWINQFYDLPNDNGKHWTVESSPSWALPMKKTGNDTIQFFVESNFETSDREGEIKIVFEDGSKVCHTIHQTTSALEDVNGEIITNTRNLSLTSGVGYTTNVFRHSESYKYHVSVCTPINFARLVTVLDSVGEADALFKEDQAGSKYESITGSTFTSIANQLSVNAGLEVGTTGFKGSVAGGFKSDGGSAAEHHYAILEIKHIVGSKYMRGGMLRYFAEKGINIFQSRFNSYCKVLEKEPENEIALHGIVEDFGTHVITYGSLGCEMKLSMDLELADGMKSTDINAAVELGAKTVSVKGDFKMSDKEENISKNLSFGLITYGGDNKAFKPSFNMDFDALKKMVMNKETLDMWVAGMHKGALALVDMQVISIADLLPTEKARENMRNYIINNYQTDYYLSRDENYKGPDLYILKNIPGKGEFACSSSIEIPEIDMEIRMERKIFDKLSTTEFSTLIYSGPVGEVNRDKGFFVGSETRKPCKFSTDRQGNFSTEEFQLLPKAPLEELYVDASGDITIVAKTSPDLYRTLDFNPLQIEDENHTVSKDAIIAVHIRNGNLIINENVHVTLDDFSVYNGSIICKGDATITFRKGTDIVATGHKAAGISIGKEGTTVNLNFEKGTHKIISERGAGIGGGSVSFRFLNKVGNIIINGSDGADIRITAEGGAGIGGVSNSDEGRHCGDITIDGGSYNIASTVATSIGTGMNSARCGDITIGSKVTRMILRKGSKAQNHIGKYDDGCKCGNITINTKNISQE